MTPTRSVGLSLLCVCRPCLDIPRNARPMNVELAARPLPGWVVPAQVLSHAQAVGAVIVIGGMVLLSCRQQT